MLLGDTIPNFDLHTTQGNFKLYDFMGNSWCIIFSHPADFTPVCTTELARAAQLAPKFEQRNVKMLGLSFDTVDNHKGWIKDIQCFGKLSGDFPFPLIDDSKRVLGVKLGMIDPDELDYNGKPLTARSVLVIGPDKRLKLSILYPATTGRNFDEILRTIDSLQLTAKSKVATPVDWKTGTECVILPTLSDEAANKAFPKGFSTVDMPSGRPYMRYTAV